MAEEIKALIDKIQKEGFKKAEEEKTKIIAQAQKEASQIIEEAQRKASLLIKEAEKEAANLKDTTQSSLKQAGRDFLIVLRGQIEEFLKKIIRQKIKEIFDAQTLGKILQELIKEAIKKQEATEIEITLNPEDLLKIKEEFFSELAKEVSRGVSLKASDNLKAGFFISFDQGKSHFDFSDEALAEYLTNFLRKELKGILTK